MSFPKEIEELRIPFTLIKQATNNFAAKNLIEQDDVWKVYRGELLRPEGFITVSFKRLDRALGKEKAEFSKTIWYFSKCRHKHIVHFVGFYDNSDELIIVHELPKHGSLDNHLSSRHLTWVKRLQICFDAAQALDYLHNHCSPMVLHGSMKSENILLDENWVAKIADVGLYKSRDYSTFVFDNENRYADPLLAENDEVSERSDIYSFGVVLFQVLSGSLAITVDEDNIHNFSRLVCRIYEKGSLDEITDPILRKQTNRRILKKFSTLAYRCLSRYPDKRLNIFQIVEKLNDLLGLQQEYEESLTVLQFLEEFAHLRIPLEDIKQATNNFATENFIESGGFGKMYKGGLLQPEGLVMVTFKPLDKALGQGSLTFWKEIVPLFTYRHENIASLVGFCNESDHMILVQEFSKHGSLEQYLSSAKLTWLKRLQICLGAARGLNYLHYPPENLERVIHCDIKSANILLDENWHAKVANFGLINPINDQSNFVVTDGIGTIAYADPLLVKKGRLSIESDIYSFGVVLFEVLCGRLAITTHGHKAQLLSRLACQHYENGKLSEIIDPILRKQMNAESLNIYSAIAYQCLITDQHKRPTIIEVLEKLEQVVGLQQEFEKELVLQQAVDNLKGKLEDEDDSYKVKNMEHMKIPLEDIKVATHDFHDNFKIGVGGFGIVYKADLFHFDVKKYARENRLQRHSLVELSDYPRRQSTVAIKRLDRRYGQGTAEFLQEISMLPYFTHKNLVTLVGFCDDNHEHILIYEYASNGSLDKHIHSSNANKSHTWATRLQICLDAAYGLDFLHNGVGEHYRIIHRDIKSSNILLGRNYIGMISDFGLSKIGPANLEATFVMTQVAGTPLYIDPQYQRTRKLTKESDVYSFGVVLFEALSGRLAHSRTSKDDIDSEFLLDMAKRCFEQNNVKDIIDSKFKKEFEKTTEVDQIYPHSINIFAAIAYKCCKEKREDRPTMAEVVKELEKAFKSHVKGVETLRTTLDDVRVATNDFRDIKEQEPLGEVYYGELSHFKGHNVNTVTIKRLRPSAVDSYAEDFCKEIARLHSYSHENIVQVLGFCEEQGERIIIYEHMVKGSLKEHLTNTCLTWKQRLNICVDVAYGLAHIHSHADQLIHGDIKSSSILLRHDWKAAISDFIIYEGAGTLGYLDPLYATTSSLTQKSDVYSFGVVLFEILSGRLAIDMAPKDDPPQLKTARWTEEDERSVVFLSHLATECFKNQKIEDIIFHAIKKQIEPKSLVIFSTIANQCLMEHQDDRPTMVKVVEELQQALNCQDEWEWEQKLPRDYEQIIQMSKCPLPCTTTKKDLHSLLCSGILLKNEKWISLSKDGVRNEMVSAKRFSYKDVSSLKWRSVQNSRFPKIARIFDISNLNIRIQITTQFLTPKMMYGAYLVFKFCDRRKVSSRPLYVNLKYKKEGETFNAYFAEWKEGRSEWLRVELFRSLSNDQGSNDFDALLVSFSPYYCGRGGIFVEGIEFQAIPNNKFFEEGTNVGGVLETKLDMNDSVEKLISDNKEIISRSGKNVQNASTEELYSLLSKGIPIDEGEKFFSLSKVNRKKCHMLPAKAIICSSNVKLCKHATGSSCRFSEVIEILSHEDFCIKCDIDTQMLSSDTTYACFLVFKLSKKCRGLKCPVKARDLGSNKNEVPKIISFTYPSTVNLEKFTWVPALREDGWMEVVVWEIILDSTHNDAYVPMHLKLTCFEGNMYGLILYGIEFRPIE